MLSRLLSRPLPAAWARGCFLALLALSFAGCRTTGPIAQSSTDFRLQNIEAALVKIQGEVQALESRQAEGDKTWGEVRAKLDELTQLVRSRTGEPGPASVQDAPPPWAGQPMAAAPAAGPISGPASGQAAAPPPPAGPGEKSPTPYAPPGKTASPYAQNDKGRAAPASDVGRPFPATPPGQTAQAVQAAALSEPTPPPASAPPLTSPAPDSAPPSPAAELAAASIPAPVSATAPGGNPAKTWELPGPGDVSSPAPATSHSPYPAALPPADARSAGPAPAPAPVSPVTPVATAVQAAEQAPGPTPTPYAPAPAAAPAAPGKPSPGEEADYNRALKLALNGKPREAKAAFSEFLSRHPRSSLEPNVRYWIGESDYIQGDMTQAAQSFTDVSTRYAGHHKAADSLYKLGMVQEKLGNTAAARAAYEALVRDYPASELTGNAKRKLEQLPR